VRGIEKKTKQAYEAPAMVVLGSLHELTLAKSGSTCDITCYHQGSG